MGGPGSVCFGCFFGLWALGGCAVLSAEGACVVRTLAVLKDHFTDDELVRELFEPVIRVKYTTSVDKLNHYLVGLVAMVQT